MEHDSLDSGFNLLFRSLFQFALIRYTGAQTIFHLKTALTGDTNTAGPLLDELTEEQNRIMQKIVSAQDYFLLWGPPGTGKTSIIVKHLLKYLAGIAVNRFYC